MARKSWVVTALAAVVVSGSIALAQVGPGGGGGGGGGGAPPDFQQLRQQMIERLQQQGIDPQQFQQQIIQQMQNGTLDINQLQQQLMQQGLVDQGQLDQLRQRMNQGGMNGADPAQMAQFQRQREDALLAQLKQDLAARDDEWNFLLPKVMKVLTAFAKADETGRLPTFADTNTPVTENPAVTAMRDSTNALLDRKPEAELVAKLKAYRDARNKAKADLTAAQKELVQYLSLRQESVMIGEGLLE